VPEVGACIGACLRLVYKTVPTNRESLTDTRTVCPPARPQVSNLARSALFVDEATSDQYLVYSGGANGALQFYKDPMHLSKPPRKVRDIH
jgi:hypothetical protein